jgi:hypothetical protein
MRVFTLCLAIGIMLTAACSSSSNGGAGGAAGGALAGQAAGGVTSLGGVTNLAGTTGAGGVAVLGGNTGSSTLPLQGACANLTCLSTLAGLTTSCQPSGTCTEQASATGTDACYANGVKMETLLDLTTFATTMTVKNGGSVCYSMVVTGILAPPMTIVFKDGSGTTVGTMAVDPTTNAMSVTCPGGTATVIDQSCGTGPSSLASSSQAAMAAQCDPGTCTF